MVVFFKKTLRDRKIRVLSQPEVGCWISVTNPHDKDKAWLVKDLGLPEEFIKAALDKEEVARIDSENGIRMFLFKIPFVEMEADIETIPFAVIIKPDFIITICLKEHQIISDLTSGKVKYFNTTTKTRFLLQIIQRINYYFLYYLKQIEKEAEAVEKMLQQSVGNKEISKLLGYQSTLLYFNKAASGNNVLIERLMKGTIVPLFEEDRELLEDISYDTKQALETISVFSGILTNTMDAYASIVSNNLNIVMKFLTSFTIIMSIPVMMASFYGMNVQLPLADHPQAFLLVVLASIVAAAGVAYIFVRKKYL